jgi:hypothetical protein
VGVQLFLLSQHDQANFMAFSVDFSLVSIAIIVIVSGVSFDPNFSFFTACKI